MVDQKHPLDRIARELLELNIVSPELTLVEAISLVHLLYEKTLICPSGLNTNDDSIFQFGIGIEDAANIVAVSVNHKYDPIFLKVSYPCRYLDFQDYPKVESEMSERLKSAGFGILSG